jgi:hypothetical protein
MPHNQPSSELSLETAMNENVSLVVMCIFMIASLAFLAEQITAYH